jgi:hypothetical protein
MGSDDKIVFFSDFTLDAHDFIICKLDDPAAAATSKVAVMFVAIDVLVVAMTVLEIDLLNQSTVDEEGDGSIQGGLRDSLLFIPQTQKEFVYVEVIVDREDLINDHLPFRRIPQPLFLDVFAKFLDGVHNSTIIIEFQYQ